MKETRKTRFATSVCLAAFACACWFAMTACGGAGSADPATIAAALKTEVKGWDKWPQHKDFSGIQKSTDNTHGKYVAVYMNDKAAAAMGNFSGTFPDGSIFVKRGYDDEKGEKPKGWVTILKKVAGSDPANGDWFSMTLSDSGDTGKFKADEKVGACIGCHSSAKSDTDYIRFVKDKGITF